MNCTIPGANMKVLARAIQSLARIGDDLYVEPDVNSMSLRSVNASRSAYASFTFGKSFFAFYKFEPSQTCGPSQEDSSKCKISMRSCLPIFRSPVMLDRKVENCKMSFDDEGCKLIFEMRFRHGISKTHFLPVIDCETLQVTYTKENALNCMQAQVQLFLDVTHNFLNSQEEVTLFATSQKTSICSYMDKSKSSSKTRSTEIVLDPLEFEKYNVTSEAAITFCLKEFRALLTFAEAAGQCVETCFDSGGKPVVFGVLDEGLYEASFVLSTLTPDIDPQLSTPQQMRSQNSKNPTVITGTVSKENVAPSSKQRTFQPSISNASISDTVLLEHVPELRPCIPEELNKSSQSPSIFIAVRRSNSFQKTTTEKTKLTRCEERSQSLEERKIKSNLPEREPNSVCFETLKSRPNNSSSDNNQFPTGSTTLSQKRTSKDSNSIVENFISSGISNESSVLLQIRESDNEDSDIISSPLQPKRKRFKLTDIFDSTFDPCNVPGYNIILAGDSGDECK